MLRQDLRFAFRQFHKSPLFAFTAILSLMLGIGATTAVFSVVYAILVNPYPYRDADRQAYVSVQDKAGHSRWLNLSARHFEELQQVSCIESALAIQQWSLTTTDTDLPENVDAVYVTPNASTQLGVPALLGRSLVPSDAPQGQDPQPVVVLGYKFWQRYYNGRTDILGHTLKLVHKSYAIVGVMPPRFTWQGGEVYLPLKLQEQPGVDYGAVIKLRPGVSKEAADAQLQPLVDQFARETPDLLPQGFRVHLQSLNEWVRQRMGATLGLLFAGVSLMLLISCANVSILLLARGTKRRPELALRAAVGASRGRIARLLLTESLALAICGSVAGVLLAALLVRLIKTSLPESSFPSEAAIGINVTVLLFSIGVALATGLLFGLSPALQLSHPELARAMSGSRRTTGGIRSKRTHGILVASQIALTLILLTGASEAIAAFVRTMQADLGYDPHHTMSVGIPLHENTHMAWANRVQYFEQLRERIGSLRDVVSAGISTNATPPANGWDTRFEIFGQSQLEDQQARTNLVNSQYFSVLHITLAAGRMWSHDETLRGARLALVNQTLARRYWPQGDAVGQQIRIPELKSQPPYQTDVPGSDGWLRIVGVVSDARNDGWGKPVKPAIYLPYSIQMWMWTQILVRTRGEPLAVLRAVREKVHEVDPDQQVEGRTRDLEQWITSQPEFVGARLTMILLTAYSILALALSAFGLYSVVSHIVAQRTNEFGIRMALGAQRGDVHRLVLESMAITVGCGLAVGVILSLALSHLLAARLLPAGQQTSGDPRFLAGVILLLAGTATAACLVPARRASSIEPTAALRCE
ncbi:MAG: ABC transporter permease [Bryobacterales bacterium]|nr:ABC transporter permease [Bryobacterales bacterium]